METLDLAKLLGSFTTNVLLLAALITVYIRSERREAACAEREKEFREEITDLHQRNEEHQIQFTSLVRECVASLNQVANVLR